MACFYVFKRRLIKWSDRLQPSTGDPWSDDITSLRSEKLLYAFHLTLPAVAAVSSLVTSCVGNVTYTTWQYCNTIIIKLSSNILLPCLQTSRKIFSSSNTWNANAIAVSHLFASECNFSKHNWTPLLHSLIQLTEKQTLYRWYHY